MSPSDYVRVTSTTAAKVFNIYPQKGKIAEGSDADIIVLDPSQKHTIKAAYHHSRMDTNVYEGKVITGKVTKLFHRSVLYIAERQSSIFAGSSSIPLSPVLGGCKKQASE